MVRFDILNEFYASKYKPRPYENSLTPANYLPLANRSATLVAYDDELDETVTVVGITMCWKGVADIWMFNGINACKHRIKLTRAVYNFIRTHYNMLGLQRLQAMVLEAYKHEHARNVERFGFSFEGTMKKFGPNGENVMRYALVRP
jgi:hypothetical protein